MNRYLALLLAAFTIGGAIGAVTGMYLYSLKVEGQLRAIEAKKVGSTMRHNQMCVKAWKKTPECVDWH